MYESIVKPCLEILLQKHNDDSKNKLLNADRPAILTTGVLAGKPQI